MFTVSPRRSQACCQSGNASASTYSNYDLDAGLSPGIEFNVFPYSESTRRQLTFKYSAGIQYANYTDTTIFGKTTETLGLHPGSTLSHNPAFGLTG